MTTCPALPRCPFFNDRMAGRPSTAEMMKRHFCQDDFESCARWQVCSRLGRPAVPEDLFPNQVKRAAAILLAP